MRLPSHCVHTAQASTVTPAQLAVSRDDPVRELKSDDLPTFGLPARQTTTGGPAGHGPAASRRLWRSVVATGVSRGP